MKSIYLNFIKKNSSTSWNEMNDNHEMKILKQYDIHWLMVQIDPWKQQVFNEGSIVQKKHASHKH